MPSPSSSASPAGSSTRSAAASWPWRPSCPTRERRVRAFIALGSNMGDRVAHLRGAAAGLPDVVAASPVFETVPVGGPAGQGPYLNMVVQLETMLTPRELL